MTETIDHAEALRSEYPEISFEDIRVGDRIRRVTTHGSDGDVQVTEGVITFKGKTRAESEEFLLSSPAHLAILPHTVHLVHREAPKLEPVNGLVVKCKLGWNKMEATLTYAAKNDIWYGTRDDGYSTSAATAEIEDWEIVYRPDTAASTVTAGHDPLDEDDKSDRVDSQGDTWAWQVEDGEWECFGIVYSNVREVDDAFGPLTFA